MSLSKFQNIARCLSAAGYAKHPTNEGEYHLEVDAKDSSLIYKHWNGRSFGGKQLIAQNVHPDSSAAYVVSLTLQYIICVSSSSTLRVFDYDEDEEWNSKNIPHYEVHRDGKIAACMSPDGLLHVVFQDPSRHLIYVNMTTGNSTILPVSPTVGSPIIMDILSDRVYVFYVSSKDHCIHYVAISDRNYIDGVANKCTLREGLKQFSVAIDPVGGGFDAYVLTGMHVLLYISADGKKMALGDVDAVGNFTSRRSVDQCCADAWNGTLTAGRLFSYLENDPSIINSPGGEQHITPLAAACWNGHLNVVELLLANGANPSALSPQKRTPLFFTTSRSPPKNRSAITRALLDAGAKVDECYAEDNFNTPLINAIAIIGDKDVANELLKHGASITAKNAKGETAVTMANGTLLEREMQSQLGDPTTINEWQKQLMEFLVALIMLIVTYTNSQDILNDVLSSLSGVEGLTDGV